uniref:Uncharacterized protein n=1 Tax=Anguilla anguilla TaxID=7936 RepID=A0A0E9X5J8_ANGAN
MPPFCTYGTIHIRSLCRTLNRRLPEMALKAEQVQKKAGFSNRKQSDKTENFQFLRFKTITILINNKLCLQVLTQSCENKPKPV